METRKKTILFEVILVIVSFILMGLSGSDAHAQNAEGFYVKGGTVVWVKSFSGYIAPDEMNATLQANERIDDLWRGRSGYKYKFKVIPTSSGEIGGEGELAHHPDGWTVTVRKMYSADKKLRPDTYFSTFIDMEGELKPSFMRQAGRKAAKDLSSLFSIAH